MIAATEAKDIATARVDEAERVAEAYEIQLHTRQEDFGREPTPANYRRILECRAQLAAARRHLKTATKEYKACR